MTETLISIWKKVVGKLTFFGENCDILQKTAFASEDYEKNAGKKYKTTDIPEEMQATRIPERTALK